MIYCAYPKDQFSSHEIEIKDAINKVLEKGIYIMGEEVELFEKSFTSYIGGDFGIGVANGTDAITLALKAGGIKTGDKVITVSHSAVATVAAIELAGAVPIMVDIEDKYLTIDPKLVANAITDEVKAIVAVHIYGQSADNDSLITLAKKHNLLFIEDCAQAHGAKYKGKTLGSMGHFSCFSFYPTKNLGAIGDGGFTISNTKEANHTLKIIRQYGWKERYISEIPGTNSRLDELQAAILSVKLKYLNEDNEKRRNIASIYTKEFQNLPLRCPEVRENTEHVFHIYALRVEDKKTRDSLIEHLKSDNIFPLIHYPQPIHLQKAYIDRIKTAPLAITEKLSETALSLPIYPELSLEDTEKVIKSMMKFYSNFK